MRNIVTLPVCEYSGAFPVLSNTVEAVQGVQFSRFNSSSGFRPFHCFVDDWRLEGVWRCSRKMVERACLSGVAVAPDFSVFAGYPGVYSLYQVWRSRVVAAWWAAHGVHVVPVLQWSSFDDPVLDALFQGLEGCEVVAVRCPSRDSDLDDWFCCAERFLEIYRPKLVLHFGLKRGSEVWPDCDVLPLNAKGVR